MRYNMKKQKHQSVNLPSAWSLTRAQTMATLGFTDKNYTPRNISSMLDDLGQTIFERIQSGEDIKNQLENYYVLLIDNKNSSDRKKVELLSDIFLKLLDEKNNSRNQKFTAYSQLCLCPNAQELQKILRQNIRLVSQSTASADKRYCRRIIASVAPTDAYPEDNDKGNDKIFPAPERSVSSIVIGNEFLEVFFHAIEAAKSNRINKIAALVYLSDLKPTQFLEICTHKSINFALLLIARQYTIMKNFLLEEASIKAIKTYIIEGGSPSDLTKRGYALARRVGKPYQNEYPQLIKAAISENDANFNVSF